MPFDTEIPMIARQLVVAALVLGLGLGSGCSKSSTSEASSESSSGSSSSSSGSSSGPSRYVKDVRQYTYEYVLSGGEFSQFSRGIGPIAEKRGVADWENDADTYDGIGRGLKKTGVTGARFELLKEQLAGSDPQRTAWIQAAYEKEKEKD
jgi:hypothetical protein